MDFETSIKVLVLGILLFFFIARSRFTRHYTAFTPRILIKYVVALLLMGFYVEGFFDSATLPFGQEIRFFAGIPVIFLGMVLFFWAHIHLGANWSPIIEKKFTSSRRLITSGPYRFIRHPTYTASFIVLAGFFVLTANWLLAGIPFIILVVFYAHKIPLEENKLVRNFGNAYRTYMKTTGRFLPNAC